MASRVGTKRKHSEIKGRHDRDADDDISDDEYDPVGHIGGPRSSEPAPLNVAGLHNSLAEIRADLPWVERLEVVSADPVTVDSTDDLKLELAFYGQALAAVTAARAELERLGVPHLRPDDYFAEMMKSDEHMQKIKDKLIQEQRRIAAVDSRRKQRDSLKYLKQVAAEKAKGKAEERRAHDDSMRQWKRHRTDAEHAGAGKSDDAEGAAAASSKRGAGGKRRAKDRRYGFGGPKQFRKDNSATSSASTRSFSVGRNKALPPGIKPKGGKKPKNAGGSRPGKRARSSQHGKGRG